uniref:AAA-like domain-containing protein n=1 Tax=Candidatus Kentrum sp. MB TaxID=2138164 RepID=A0A450XA69_9GAMM|nr:MAG: AAA-like domain-containing protein [Candidatus Kentron sp. MB]
MPKRFNTTGPCLPEEHYMIPPEERLPQVRQLIAEKFFFTIHAPRQTGKTTLLNHLSRTLVAEGKYAALTISLECFTDVAESGEVMPQLLKELSMAAEYELPDDLRPPPISEFIVQPLIALKGYLSAWSASIRLPLVLFLDEIDSVTGPVLISILRQLRDGYTRRPRPFPQSVALVGLRDVRDYRLQVRADVETLGTSSPFNIKVESLSIGNFTREEVERLLAQHTKETGQPFEPDATAEIFRQTNGQPWLVNALANQLTTHYDALVKDRTAPVQREHVLKTREILIERRDTHLDSLVHRLQEEQRIKRVIQPILTGDAATDPTYDDDFSYTRGLGLVTIDQEGLYRIANPIYAEIISRVLTQQMQTSIPATPDWYVGADETLDMMKLIRGFLDFWRENGEILLQAPYQEAAPHLVFMAWLQRIVNSGGRVDREFALGAGRADLVVRYGERGAQKEIIELKIVRGPKTVEDGVGQVSRYARRLGIARGYLVVFPGKAPLPQERDNEIEEREADGVTVVIARVAQPDAREQVGLE